MVRRALPSPADVQKVIGCVHEELKAAGSSAAVAAAVAGGVGRALLLLADKGEAMAAPSAETKAIGPVAVPAQVMIEIIETECEMQCQQSLCNAQQSSFQMRDGTGLALGAGGLLCNFTCLPCMVLLHADSIKRHRKHQVLFVRLSRLQLRNIALCSQLRCWYVIV